MKPENQFYNQEYQNKIDNELKKPDILNKISQIIFKNNNNNDLIIIITNLILRSNPFTKNISEEEKEEICNARGFLLNCLNKINIDLIKPYNSKINIKNKNEVLLKASTEVLLHIALFSKYPSNYKNIVKNYIIECNEYLCDVLDENFPFNHLLNILDKDFIFYEFKEIDLKQRNNSI